MEPLATGYGSIEGPVWDPEEGLYWSDVAHGGAHRLARSGAVTTVIPHRRGIGGIARHADGGLVVGGRNIAWKSLIDDRGAVLLDPARLPDVIGFKRKPGMPVDELQAYCQPPQHAISPVPRPITSPVPRRAQCPSRACPPPTAPTDTSRT